MVDLDPSASRADHEAAIAERLTEVDPQLGGILAPYLGFEKLEGLNDSERRNLRSEIATAVRAALDAEGDDE
jgi:hypothetical protein